MKLGLMSKTFPGNHFENVCQKLSQTGMPAVHFNPESANLPKEEGFLTSEICSEIQKNVLKYNLSLESLSGTYNMIDPNLSKREKGKRWICEMIRHAKQMGCDTVTLCTGTNDPKSMWGYHPENSSRDSWLQLCREMEQILDVCEQSGVTALVEPEYGNVMQNATKARALLNDCQSSHLKVIMDGANLFSPGSVEKMDDVLKEAFFLLGEDIGLAHGKDILHTEELRFVAAGKGVLNWKLYFELLRECNYQDAVIVHGLSAEEVDGSREFLMQYL